MTSRRLHQTLGANQNTKQIQIIILKIRQKKTHSRSASSTVFHSKKKWRARLQILAAFALSMSKGEQHQLLNISIHFISVSIIIVQLDAFMCLVQPLQCSSWPQQSLQRVPSFFFWFFSSAIFLRGYPIFSLRKIDLPHSNILCTALLVI